MPNVTACYGWFSDLIAFFWDFSCTITCEMLQLHQTFTSCKLKQKCRDKK